jgi:hypothetical protein
MFEIQYEELMANQEGKTRALLGHCDLPWEETCLYFYKNERAIRTASHAQVRQPMYRTSIASSRKYYPYSFVEACSFESEEYFIALIRMYERSVNCVLSLPLAERRAYVERLGKLRLRTKHVGWSVEDEFNDLWHAADFDEQ